jgi:hypothetical protein
VLEGLLHDELIDKLMEQTGIRESTVNWITMRHRSSRNESHVTSTAVPDLLLFSWAYLRRQLTGPHARSTMIPGLSENEPNHGA